MTQILAVRLYMRSYFLLRLIKSELYVYPMELL